MAKIPVFVVHGFLESGKTRFVQETLADDYFSGGERNLVIACEEGVEEYEDELLQKTNTTLVVLEDKSEFNEMFLAECQKKYKPTQIIVEYNCMWGLDYLREMYMPKGWFVAQVITTVDATTFDVYLKNMKSLFMEMAKDSDLIIFNRSTDETPAATYKRNMLQGDGLYRRTSAEGIFRSWTYGYDLLCGRYGFYRLPVQICLCGPDKVQTMADCDCKSAY